MTSQTSRKTHARSRSGWRQIIGISCLGGIGFTMSLFITELAFTDTALQAAAKIGILIGSALAGLAGWLVLRQTAQSDAAAPVP